MRNETSGRQLRSLTTAWLFAGVVFVQFLSVASADAQSDWLAQRQAAFATYRAAHPNLEAEIADLKAKTAALVAAARNQPKYADLIARERSLSPAMRQRALGYFSTGFILWKAGSFQAAELAFKQGLDIDPANGGANYYYGDCLQRRGDRSEAAEYMTRAVALGSGSPESFNAQVALQSLPAPVDLTPRIWRVPGAISEVWDAAEAPVMEVIPAGEYTMGSSTSNGTAFRDEFPQHSVTIAYPLAVGRYDVTYDEYAAFVSETRYQAKPDDHCFWFDHGHWNKTASANWQRPGFGQSGRDPVVCIGWDDAQEYAAWLSQKSGHRYRLLSESEWEYAARGGTTTSYYWGDVASHEFANYGSETCCSGLASGHDQWVNTSPVGAFPQNPFGLYDMAGNVWQWTADCLNESYSGAPSNGDAWTSGDCKGRILRGGSWNYFGSDLRSDWRVLDPSTVDRSYDNGFRVARTL